MFSDRNVIEASSKDCWSGDELLVFLRVRVPSRAPVTQLILHETDDFQRSDQWTNWSKNSNTNYPSRSRNQRREKPFLEWTHRQYTRRGQADLGGQDLRKTSPRFVLMAEEEEDEFVEILMDVNHDRDSEIPWRRVSLWGPSRDKKLPSGDGPAKFISNPDVEIDEEEKLSQVFSGLPSRCCFCWGQMWTSWRRRLLDMFTTIIDSTFWRDIISPGEKDCPRWAPSIMRKREFHGDRRQNERHREMTLDLNHL